MAMEYDFVISKCKHKQNTINLCTFRVLVLDGESFRNK